MRPTALPLLLALLAACSGGQRPKAGELAPPFALPTSDGGTAALADYAGKTLVLAFFPKAFTGG